MAHLKPMQQIPSPREPSVYSSRASKGSSLLRLLTKQRICQQMRHDRDSLPHCLRSAAENGQAVLPASDNPAMSFDLGDAPVWIALAASAVAGAVVPALLARRRQRRKPADDAEDSEPEAEYDTLKAKILSSI